MKNDTNDNDRCFLCTCFRDGHQGMDHPFKSLADQRGEYEKSRAEEVARRAAAAQNADGRIARKDLRSDFMALLETHFAAGNGNRSPEERQEATDAFVAILEDIQMSLDTLEETCGA